MKQCFSSSLLMLSCSWAQTKEPLTFEDGAILIRALEVALLSQLFAVGSAGDVRLDAKAVALPTVKPSHLDLAALRDLLFLEATHNKLA